MIDLEMDKFENLLDGYILSKGIDKAIHQVIFPFLERIGIYGIPIISMPYRSTW